MARNLNSFGHLSPVTETIGKQTTKVLGDIELDRIELARLVETPGWQVLKKYFKDYAESFASPIPSTVSHLIGYASYSIVRDTKDALVNRIESEAKLAPREWDMD